MWDVALGLLILAANLLALWDILRQAAPLGEKLLWLALVWLFPFVGVVIYLAVGRGALKRSGRGQLLAG